ncbi:hypothetical protein Scep_025502 [Stephania cephalantha]|uniref:Uncharacterized protein n=1 Tax=Stephania cephalantha TaxID=152367 RepID=A0AAP0HMD2_9MAGN
MVQGASRGIGLEFGRQLLEREDKGHVVATCRNPNGATGLLELKRKFSKRLNILQLDVTNESTIEVGFFFLYPLLIQWFYLLELSHDILLVVKTNFNFLNGIVLLKYVKCDRLDCLHLNS